MQPPIRNRHSLFCKSDFRQKFTASLSMERLKIVRMRISSNQRRTYIEQHSLVDCAYFRNKRHEAFVDKKIINIIPSLPLTTKRVQFSPLVKISLVTRKRRTAIHFERHSLTELHVFQKLRESHNMKNRSIKKYFNTNLQSKM